MARIAWFSPMPPARTGVAVYSHELVSALRTDHDIEVFVDDPMVPFGHRSAHDFLWKHRLDPYDLTVYQLGNSSAHDFMWPYLFRFPGLAVLHDAHLHHARAASLLRQRRPGDYRAEFARNHPDTAPDLAELAVAGFDSHLYYMWPMTRLVTRRARLTAVHAPLMAVALQDESPAAEVDTIRLGHGTPVSAADAGRASARVRDRHGIPPDGVIFGLFGGLTPEKRVPQVLAAFATLRPYEPSAWLMLVGAPAGHYDVVADIARLGIGDQVIVTGYVGDEADFTDYIAACDVSLNLRWPTAREMSGPWLRAMAAGRATVTMDLAHMADIPSLDPRTWLPMHASLRLEAVPEPVTIGIDVLDEDHSLRLAMRRLAADADLRARLGRAASAYWRREHSMERMLEDYRRVLQRAIAAPVPPAALPAHLRSRGDERLAELLEPFGLPADVWSTI